jgi:hypothetical protein
VTAFRDHLTPPREPLSPAAHYRIADQLLAELSELRPHELNLPYAKAKLALADIHARLAGCVVPDSDQRRATPHGDRGTCYCGNCGLRIGFNYDTGWFHVESGIAHCFRDPQHTETATPETATTAERI